MGDSDAGVPAEVAAKVREPAWRVKYDGACALCGSLLRKGTPAIWDRASRTMHCIACPPAAASSTADAATESMPALPEAGVAGGSARHEYERRRDKRETEVRGRWGNRLGGLILALNDEPRSTRAWATGARGEEKLAKALADLEGVRFLHDRRAPGTRGNIDHLVIAPSGIFVVDAKNYSGLIEVVDRGGLFRQDLRLLVGRGDCSYLATNMSWQVEAVTMALHQTGVASEPPIRPVLCFVDGEWPLLFPPDSYLGVRLESPKSIRRLITAKGDLGVEEVDGLTALLAEALPAK